MRGISILTVQCGNRSAAAAMVATLHRLATATAVTLGLGACAGDLDSARGLDAADVKLIAQATQQTLEASKVGESSNWNNPVTGHLGTITPTRTFENDERQPCRDFQQTATVDGRTQFAFDSACRTADGAWYSLNYDSLADAIRHGGTQLRPYDHYRRDPFYDPWCRFPYQDHWCGSRSGFSLGVGSRF